MKMKDIAENARKLLNNEKEEKANVLYGILLEEYDQAELALDMAKKRLDKVQDMSIAEFLLWAEQNV